MTFTTKRLVGSRVLVQGVDVNNVAGSAVLDSSQWDDLSHRSTFDKAKQDFDSKVEEFFAPLTDAADALAQATAEPKVDSLTYVVLSEGSEGTPSRPERRVQLSHDSQVLRLIEAGDSDRLVWVDGGLEILEVLVNVPTAQPSGDPHASEITDEQKYGS